MRTDRLMPTRDCLPDEFEIRAVVANTGCSRETAIETLAWSCCRIGLAIMRIRDITERERPGLEGAYMK